MIRNKKAMLFCSQIILTGALLTGAPCLASGSEPDYSGEGQIHKPESLEAPDYTSDPDFVDDSTDNMLETGWLQYGGDSGASQFNFAGIGTTGGGVAGVSYPDVRTGIRAQVQHLKAYACEEALNQDCVDTRFDLVARGSAPYVEWLGQQENPNGGGWAAGSDYGEKLRKLLAQLKAE